MTFNDFSILGKKILISIAIFLVPLVILKGGLFLVEQLLH